jgi:hypothetical protein
MMSDFENVTPNPESVPEMGDEPRTPLEAFIHHQRRAMEETVKAIDALLPEGFKEHGSAAGKEFVKGLKVLADAFIDEIEKMTTQEEGAAEEGDDKPSTTGPTKVKVQVE